MDKDTLQNGNDTVGDERQYLTFLLGGKTFGIDVATLKEIIKYVRPEEIDDRVKSVDGVIGLRGIKVPVIDLRRLFSFDLAVTDKSRIILLLIEGYLLGVIVDEVFDVEALGPDEEVMVISSDSKSSRTKGSYMKYVEGFVGARSNKLESDGDLPQKTSKKRVVMMLKTGSLLTKKDKDALFA